MLYFVSILEKAYSFFISSEYNETCSVSWENWLLQITHSFSGLFSYLLFYFLSGKFREKASILHKIAKKKCQVEDSNGVAGKW